MSFIDRNSSTPLRDRRNSQRIRAGDATSSVEVGAPLTIGPHGITLVLAPAGGLQVAATRLSLLLADSSVQLSTSGLSVKEADTSLAVSSGLKVNLADTSLATASGVKVNLATNSGLTVSSGLKLLLTDTSLALGAGGVGVNPNASGGLQISSGLGIKLADSSLQTTSSGESVALMSNGGLQVSSGLGILLDDTSGLVTLLSYDFTVLTAGTNVGAIGGSGTTWYVTQNSSQPTIPDGTQVDSATTIQAFSGFPNVAAANTTANGTQAQYVPTLATGSNYTITLHAIPETVVAGGVQGGIGIFVRADKTGHSASQGISVQVFTDLIRIQDQNGGAVLGSTAISPALSPTTAYDIVLTVTGNSFSASVNGFTASGTSTNNAANTGIGFWMGKFVTAAQGVQHFTVQSAGTPTHSGLKLSATGVALKLADTSLTVTSSGVAVTTPIPNQPTLLFVNTADSTPIANTVTAGNFDVNYTFASGYWSAGKAVRIRAIAVYSVTGTPTLAPLLQFGGVTITGFSFNAGSGTSGARMMFDATIVCRTTGSSGTFGRSADFAFEIGPGTTLTGPDGGSVITVNTTSTTLLAFNFQWGTASTSNTAKLHQLEVLALN